MEIFNLNYLIGISVVLFALGCEADFDDPDHDLGMSDHGQATCTPWNHQYRLQWDCPAGVCPVEYALLQIDMASESIPYGTGITVLTDDVDSVFGSLVVDFSTDCALSGFANLHGAYLKTCLVEQGVIGELRYGPDAIVGAFTGTSAGVFDFGDRPAPFVCGGDHEPCCPSADDGLDTCLCHPGNELVSATCFACGGPGQPCCDGFCSARATCTPESDLCVPCGGFGQSCCAGLCEEGPCSAGTCI